MTTIEWQGKTLTMSDLTVKIKEEFCEWCCNYKIAHAAKHLSGNPEALAVFVSKWDTNTVWWGDGEMAGQIWDVLKGRHGTIKLHRMLFGDSIKHLNDHELYQMIRAKEADPASDYVLAFKRMYGIADPKAEGAANSVAPAEGTITTV